MYCFTSRTLLTRLVTALQICVACLLVQPLPLRAQGGAPMITHDGGTPGNGHWEINIVAGGAGSGTAKSFYAPDIDLNYGIGRTMQIKLEVPYIWDNGGGGDWRTGVGNSTLGFKWRMRDDDPHGVGVSIYPHLDLHNPRSSSYERGLVGPAPQLFIPLSLAHQIGAVAVNTELGYRLVSGATDAMTLGFLLGGRPASRLELMGELFGTKSVAGDSHNVLANVGTRFHFTPLFGLIASGGHTVEVSSDQDGGWVGFAAVQLTF